MQDIKNPQFEKSTDKFVKQNCNCSSFHVSQNSTYANNENIVEVQNEENTEQQNWNEEELAEAVSNWLKTYYDIAYDDSEERKKKIESIEQEIKKCKKDVDAELERVAVLLVPTFKAYKIDVELVNKYSFGQRITFGIRPAKGVRINLIKNILLDVSLAIGISPFKMYADLNNSLIYLYTNTNISFPKLPDEPLKGYELIREPIFKKAVMYALKSGRVSPSMLQTELETSYRQAAYIVDLLDEMCLLGASEPDGSTRKFLMTAECIINKHS